MSYTNVFNFDWSKILAFGKELELAGLGIDYVLQKYSVRYGQNQNCLPLLTMFLKPFFFSQGRL